MPKAAPRLRQMPRMAPRHCVQPTDENYGKGRGGRPWRRKRDRIMARDGRLCVPCRAAGRLTLATEVDHVVPKAEGGADDDSNLQAICDDCHAVKTKAEAARGVGRKSKRF